MDENTDPNCSAESPYKLKFEEITSAAFKIKNGVVVTPCKVCLLF